MNWIVKNVKPQDNYCLLLTFEDGKVKSFDMKPYLNLGIFKELKDKKVFDTVSVSFGSVIWQNEADFDPRVLYNEGKIVA